MSLLCNPCSFSLTTDSYFRTTKPIVSSLQFHSREESFKSVLPLFSHPPRQIQLSSSKTSANAAKESFTLTAPYPLTQTIEHITIFKMKPSTNLAMLVDQINNMKGAVPGMLYLSGGILHDYSYPSPHPSYNVFLHARFRSQQDVDAYIVSPQKGYFTSNYTEAYYEDYMNADWFAYTPDPLPSPKLWSALRLTLFKMDDGGWGPVYEGIKDVYGKGGATQVTYGQNYVGKDFRTMTKGFQLSALAVFPGIYEMKALGTAQEFRTKLEERLKPTVSEVIVVDYIVSVLYDAWM